MNSSKLAPLGVVIVLHEADGDRLLGLGRGEGCR